MEICRKHTTQIHLGQAKANMDHFRVLAKLLKFYNFHLWEFEFGWKTQIELLQEYYPNFLEAFQACDAML